MLLKIVCNGLGGAEILHGLRNLHTELLAQLKESINCGTCRKNYRSIIEYVDSLCTELSGSQRLHLEKLSEVKLSSKLLCDCCIRRSRLRLLLCDQYLLYAHSCLKNHS